jgi:hypothetical protein
VRVSWQGLDAKEGEGEEEDNDSQVSSSEEGDEESEDPMEGSSSDDEGMGSDMEAWRMQKMRKRMGWGMVSSSVGRKRRWVESQGVRRGRRAACKLDQHSTAVSLS